MRICLLACPQAHGQPFFFKIPGPPTKKWHSPKWTKSCKSTNEENAPQTCLQANPMKVILQMKSPFPVVSSFVSSRQQKLMILMVSMISASYMVYKTTIFVYMYICASTVGQDPLEDRRANQIPCCLSSKCLRTTMRVLGIDYSSLQEKPVFLILFVCYCLFVLLYFCCYCLLFYFCFLFLFYWKQICHTIHSNHAFYSPKSSLRFFSFLMTEPTF